jgi:hypothetical protein
MAARVAVGRRYGVDLSQIPIDRSAAAAAQARRMQARAFTSPEGVVIPPEAGSLDAGPGQALLVHELTHVVQQAGLGAFLPPEGTPAGMALEAEALVAEAALVPRSPSLKWGTGTTQPPPALALAERSEASRRGPGVAARAPDTHRFLARGDGAYRRELSSATRSAVPGRREATPVSVPVAAPAVAALVGVQRAVEAPPEAALAAGGAEGEAQGPFVERPSEPDLARLARWLYPIISYRLKGELKEDRERAGLLTDSYRRW